MNERIRELAVSAGMSQMNRRSDGFFVVDEKVFEKFAELLIKECILIARKAENEDEVYSWYAISNHFGVES